ncbi:MAG: asparagine synthase-related protein [Bacteroidota bacterium]
MSRNFCGIVNLNGDVNPSSIEQMAEKLNINNLYSIGLDISSQCRFASLTSSTVPRRKSCSWMPALRKRYQIVSFSMLVRLEDLEKKLGGTLDLTQLSEEDIILLCYAKWNKDLVKHLEGDWACAIWDFEKQELFLARNPHGDATIFYHQKGNTFYFSSLLTGLVGIDGINNVVDKEKLFMECFTASAFETRTFYKEIYFLKPAHFMVFSTKGIRSVQYWKPYELPKTILADDREYIEAYIECYGKAVNDRLKRSENWGFSMSGGLDSAATMAIVAKYFAKRNETAEVLTFVPTYPEQNAHQSDIRHGDESELVREIAALNGHINLHLVSKFDPFWGFMVRYTKELGGPPHMTGVLFADILAEAAREKQMSHVMIAQGGNQGLSFEGVASHTDIGQFYEDLKYGLSSRLSPVSIIGYFIKAIISSGKKSYRKFTAPNKKRIAELISDKTLLSEEFIRSVNGYDLMETHLFGSDDNLSEGERKFRKKIKIGKHCRLGLWNQLGTRYDVQFVDPTRDKRFLELIITFPNHIFNRKGVRKYLFREAFKGQVPENVLHFKKQGINLSELGVRYQRDMNHFESLLDAKRDDPLFNEVIDQTKLVHFCKAIKECSEFSSAEVSQIYDQGATLFQVLLI